MFSSLATIKEALLGWSDTFVGKRHKEAWISTPLCIFWVVWKEKNRRSFDNEEHLDHYLKSSFLSTPFSWVKCT